MGRGKTGLQVRPSQLFSFIIRFSVPTVVLIWMVTGWTDTITPNAITLKNAAPSFDSAHQLSHAQMVRRMGPDGRSLRGQRNDNLLSFWSGYVVTGGPFTSAQATWVVPTVSYVSYPAAPQVETVSNWVGIDGYNESQLIQLGTSQTVTKDNVATYSVWYEILPPTSVNINATRFVVSPGDTITASIQCIAPCAPNNPTQPWVLGIVNKDHWTFTIQLQYSAPLLTAEWIVEPPSSPSDCSNPVDCMSYLPDFGSTTFTAISLNNANPNLSRSQNAIMATDPNGKAWSVPSDPVGGNSFTMTFGRPPSP